MVSLLCVGVAGAVLGALYNAYALFAVSIALAIACTGLCFFVGLGTAALWAALAVVGLQAGYLFGAWTFAGLHGARTVSAPHPRR